MERRPRTSRGGAQGTYYSLSKRLRPGAERVACVVSKKVASRAVDRNKAKRVCRAVFAPHVREKDTQRFVVHVRKPALGAPHATLVREASELVRRVITRHD